MDRDKFLLQHVLDHFEEGKDQSKRAKKSKDGDYEKYTCNGVPIRKVFVRNVLPKLNKERLLKIFQKFGPVTDVNIFDQERVRKKKCAIVTFKRAQDAEKALIKQFIKISRYRLFVFPAYGMYAGKNDSKKECSGGTSSSDVTDVPITELNLPNNVPYKFPEEFLTLPFLKGIFQSSGACLKKLDLQKAKIFGADGLIEAIGSTCQMLEDLRLEGLYMNDLKTNALKSVTTKLKVLSLVDCNPIKDFHLESMLKNNSVLTHLEVTTTNYVKGTFLKALRSPLQKLDLSYNSKLYPDRMRLKQFAQTLEHLLLSNCRLVQSCGLERIVKQVPNLKSITLQLYRVKSDSDFPLDGIERLKHLESLDLSDNEVVNDFLLGFLVEKCPQLKELNLAGTDMDQYILSCGQFTLSGINAMPNLRSLNLSNIRCFNCKILKDYAAVSPPIESLFLTSYKALTDEDIKPVLVSCHQLKHLDLSSCSEITDVTITIAKKALDKRTNNQPLTLVVGGTKILKKDRQTHHLLTIDYENTVKKDKNSSNYDEDEDYDDHDWTHLMYGTGKSEYYLGSDKDDSDFDGLNTNDFGSDHSSDDDKYNIDPRREPPCRTS